MASTSKRMEILSLNIQLDCTIFSTETDEERLQPFVMVCLDDVYDVPPTKVFVPLKSIQKISKKVRTEERETIFSDNRKRSGLVVSSSEKYHMNSLIKIHMGPIALSEDSWYFGQKRNKKSKEKTLPMDSKVLIYIATTDRDDVRLFCHLTSAAAEVRLFDLYNGKKVKAPVVDPEQNVIGTVKVSACEDPVQLSTLYRLTSQVSYRTRELSKEIMNRVEKNGSALVDAVTKGIILLPGYTFGDAAQSKQSLPKGVSSSEIVQGYAARCAKWWRDNFQPENKLTARILWFFDFNIFGKRFPANFILGRSARGNKLFFLNLFYNQCKKHMLRMNLVKGKSVDEFKQFITNTTMGDICSMFKSLSFDDKQVVMCKMFTCIANRTRYVTDQMRKNDGLGSGDPLSDIGYGNGEEQKREGDIVYIELMENGFWSLTTDCEDSSHAILSIFKAFCECEEISSQPLDTYIDSLTGKTFSDSGVLRELQLIAKCYTELMTLDKVSIKNVSLSVKQDGSSSENNFSAHMALKFIPTHHFVSQCKVLSNGISGSKVREPDEWGTKSGTLPYSESEVEKLALALDSEMKMFEHNTNELSKVSGVNNIKNRLKVLAAEPTGDFYPLDAQNPNEYEYQRLTGDKNNRFLMDFMSDTIFHSAGSQNSFYLNEMIGTTSRFLERYNLGVSCFVFTEQKEATSSVPLETIKKKTITMNKESSKLNYGVKYKELLSMLKKVKMVAMPFMTEIELNELASSHRRRQPLPSFEIRQTQTAALFERQTQEFSNSSLFDIFVPESLDYEMVKPRNSQTTLSNSNQSVNSRTSVEFTTRSFSNGSNQKRTSKSSSSYFEYESPKGNSNTIYVCAPSILGSMKGGPSDDNGRDLIKYVDESFFNTNSESDRVTEATTKVEETLNAKHEKPKIATCSNLWESIRRTAKSSCNEIMRDHGAEFFSERVKENEKRHSKIPESKNPYKCLVFEMDARCFGYSQIKNSLVEMIEREKQICGVHFELEPTTSCICAVIVYVFVGTHL